MSSRMARHSVSMPCGVRLAVAALALAGALAASPLPSDAQPVPVRPPGRLGPAPPPLVARLPEPRAVDWPTVGQAVRGAGIRTAGGLARELATPRSTALRGWSLPSRLRHLRALERAVLDPGGRLAARVSPARVAFETLRDDPEYRALQATITGLGLPADQTAGLLAELGGARRLALRYRDLFAVDLPLRGLPLVGPAVAPGTVGEILATEKLTATETGRIAASIGTVSDLAEIDPAAKAAEWRVDAGRLAALRDQARAALADPEVGRSELTRRQFGGAIEALGLSAAARAALSSAGFSTLPELLAPAASGRLRAVPQLTERERSLLRTVARLSALSPEGRAVARLATTFPSVRAVARASPDAIRAALGAGAREAEVREIADRAVALDAAIGQQLVAAAVDTAPANRRRPLYGDQARVGLKGPTLELAPDSGVPEILIGTALPDACTACVPWESAVSQAAYLVDLLDFIQDSFRMTLDALESRLRQSLASITLEQSASEMAQPQVRLASEALVRFIAERRGLNWRSVTAAQVDAIYDGFRTLPGSGPMVPDILDQAFDWYLRDLGTERETVQRVLQGAAGAPRPADLAAALGLDVADLTALARPAAQVRLSHLDQILALLQKARTRLLLRTLERNVREQEYAQRRETLLAALDRQAPDYAARVAAAEAQAATEAEAAVSAGRPALQHEAEADAAAAAAEARTRVELRLLPAARANLVALAVAATRQNPVRDATGAPRRLDDAQALGDFLFVDLMADTQRETTPVGFATETLQTLVLAHLLGKEPPTQAPAFDHARWQWSRSYGIWKAAMTVFLYPENFLFPAIRPSRTPAFQNMTDAVEAEAPTRARAQEALDRLAGEIRDLAGAEVFAAAQGGGRSYFFARGRSTRDLYYSTVDREGTWTGWRSIAALRGQRYAVRDVVSLGGRIYLFYEWLEDGSHRALTQGASGEFTEAVDLGKGFTLRGVMPVEGPFGGYIELLTAVDRASIVDPVNGAEFRDWLDRLNRARAAYNRPAVDERWFHGRAIYRRLRLDPRTKQVVPAVSYDGENGDLVFVPEAEEPIAWAEHGGVAYFLFQREVPGGYSLRVRSHFLGALEGYLPLFVDEPDSYRPSARTLDIGLGATRIVADRTWFLSMEAKPAGTGLYGPDAVMLLAFKRPSDLNVIFLDGDLDVRLESSATTGTVPYTALHRAGDRIYAVSGSRLLEYPWAEHLRTTGYLAADRWPVLGQLVVGPEDPNRPLRLPLESLARPDGRLALRQLQEAHFAHFTTGGMARQYLEELFLHAPLYLAAKLTEAGRHDHAADVYAAVFQPFAETEGCRFLYRGEEFCPDPAQPPAPRLEVRQTAAYLQDPFDPHALARLRPHAYARYTLFSSVANLLDWADAEFVRDTSESVARARELYETASGILGLSGLPPDLCAAGHTELVVTLLRGWRPSSATADAWDPLLEEAARTLRRSGTPQLARATRAELRRIIAQDAPDCVRRAEAVRVLRGLPQRPGPAPRTVGLVLARAGDARVRALQQEAEDAVLARGVALGRGGPPPAVGRGFATGVARRVFERGFCIPPNFLSEVLQLRIEANLDKIRTGRNFAGISRRIPVQSLDVDPASVVRARAAGAADLDSVIPAVPPPLHRYAFLRERARYLTTLAQQLEASFVTAVDRQNAQEYTLLQARNDLKLKREQVAVETLRVRESAERLGLAGLQHGRARFSEDRFLRLLRQGKSTYEVAALALMYASAFAPASVTFGIAPTVSYSPSGALQTLSNYAATLASYERRREEWQYQKGLAAWDVRIAESGIDLAATGVEISEKQRDLVSLSASLAGDTVEFLAQDQFRSGELYRWMQGELRRLYRDHLNLAVSTALASQRALAFELQEPLNFVGSQYWQTQREGLLGAERLLFDLERLEQHRLQRAERRREITKTLSLARLMPSEFQRFRETGVLEFTTPASWFDRDFPGHYLRLIKSVELSVLALTSPVHGINVTLANNGLSRAVVGPPWVEPRVLQRLPESVSLSAPIQASGLFELRLDDPMLLPFEGSGVETTWRLEMAPGANRIDFATLSDVLMTIRYTAREDAGYRQRVLDRLERGVKGRTFRAISQAFPDTWYHFHNPRFLADPAQYSEAEGRPRPYTLQLRLTPGHFPPNEQEIRLDGLTLASIQTGVLDIPVRVAFTPDGTSTPITAEGVIRGGTLVFPAEFAGRAPFGTWTIAVRSEELVVQYPALQDGPEPTPGQKRIRTDWLENLLVVFDYEARLHYAR